LLEYAKIAENPKYHQQKKWYYHSYDPPAKMLVMDIFPVHFKKKLPIIIIYNARHQDHDREYNVA
jgi:hypothetical protein